MSCNEFDVLLCDYLDGTLPSGKRHLMDAHLAICHGCVELVRDCRLAMEFAEGSASVEPPPELVTKILYQVPQGGRLSQYLSQFIAPVRQPRFVMGAMMTVLSLSMMTRCAGAPKHQLTAADLDPVRIVGALDDKIHRSWERTVKAYESMRLVYELQSRVREWKEKQQEEEEESRRLPQTKKTPPPQPVKTTSSETEIQ